jgi:hypothetical protein
MTCEHCHQELPTVRMRPRYHEPPIALCRDCWLDLQEALIKGRQDK